jgi:glutathione S-transferase
MIVIHHLGVSQSDRIVWLMEELGLPYELKWHHRMPNRLAPPELLALHPTATAPVIQDGEKTLTESAVIVEYLCHRYGGGRFTVSPDQPNYTDYLYWMHFNNNIMGLFFAKRALGGRTEGDSALWDTLLNRREDRSYQYADQRLASSPYLAGPEFTCADIMAAFTFTSLPLFGGRSVDDLPNVRAYVERLSARPAYRKAMEIAGPGAKPPG